MNDVTVIELVRPMTTTYLQREVERRQAERRAETEELEAKIAAAEGQDKKPAKRVTDRLRVLQSVNGTQDAKEILEANTIVIALRSVTRGQAFHRGQMQLEARQWLMDQAGVETYEEINMDNVGDSIGQVWMAMYQAADIVCALVTEECKGWEIPKHLEEWADVPDWIFTRALSETWALNPQFTMVDLSGEA